MPPFSVHVNGPSRGAVIIIKQNDENFWRACDLGERERKREREVLKKFSAQKFCLPPQLIIYN